MVLNGLEGCLKLLSWLPFDNLMFEIENRELLWDANFTGGQESGDACVWTA